MSEPRRESWSPEPWHATMNGTIYCDEGPIGDMDDPAKADPSYASDRDVADAARCAACVNAMVGLASPHALPDVLAAVASLRDAMRSVVPELGAETAGEVRVVLRDLEDAVRHLRDGESNS